MKTHEFAAQLIQELALDDYQITHEKNAKPFGFTFIMQPSLDPIQFAKINSLCNQFDFDFSLSATENLRGFKFEFCSNKFQKEVPNPEWNELSLELEKPLNDFKPL